MSVSGLPSLHLCGSVCTGRWHVASACHGLPFCGRDRRRRCARTYSTGQHNHQQASNCLTWDLSYIASWLPNKGVDVSDHAAHSREGPCEDPCVPGIASLCPDQSESFGLKLFSHVAHCCFFPESCTTAPVLGWAAAWTMAARDDRLSS